MEQRPLRLGDILDDYCPRERRVTNHAVVAMIDEDVKQTRCTTCDTEHPYKGGKEPRKRKKETPGALYREVLAGLDPDVSPILTAPPPEQSEPVDPEDPALAAVVAPLEDDSDAADINPDAPPAAPIPDVEEGPVHRPLIRATLPRVEGQKEARQMPEFTVRHSGNRGNGKRGETSFRSRGPGGNRPQGAGGPRVAGSRGSNRGPGPGGGRPGAGGFRSDRQGEGRWQQPRHGGRKRSR